MHNNILIGLLMLIVGTGVGYTLGDDTTSVSGNHMMGDGSMMSQNIDQHFIVQMIPHHEGAIEMSKIALERSERAEIRSLAQGIIEAQQKEINDMSAWYETWFGATPPRGGMGMMHMGGMEVDIDALRLVPAEDFDREFILQMIPHHEMAIVMAQMLLAATERPEMKQLGDNIVTSQSREIDMMRSWLGSWYGN